MARMKARHAGKCADCGIGFEAGTAIRWFRSTGALCQVPCRTVRPTADESRAAWLEHVATVATDPIARASWSAGLAPATVARCADDLSEGIEAARRMVAALIG